MIERFMRWLGWTRITANPSVDLNDARLAARTIKVYADQLQESLDRL